MEVPGKFMQQLKTFGINSYEFNNMLSPWFWNFVHMFN